MRMIGAARVRRKHAASLGRSFQRSALPVQNESTPAGGV